MKLLLLYLTVINTNIFNYQICKLISLLSEKLSKNNCIYFNLINYNSFTNICKVYLSDTCIKI